ncbi:radical SAM protein [Solirubrobacter soli]|uniref:radical SAM protein n=1 Tax=Solirubrobacter soli TaxID=363832 RepID=UPI00042621A7|nr:radical SAM protein [Solirubrobacter soli]
MRWEAEIADGPEALTTRFHEVQAKSALNRVQGRMPWGWTINPYRGCTHACTYCFARPTHEYLGMNAGDDFEREIVVKVNVAEVLRTELGKPSWKREHVALGTNTDPYQWVEGRYQLMRGIWKALRDAANPCSVLTKSPLLTRDIDLMLQIAERTRFTAYLSVPTIDERAWRESEPRTPSPRARLEALQQLAGAGLDVGVVIAPLMPGINDSPEQIEEIVAAAERAGAESIDALPLHLRGSTKQVFLEWLRTTRPELVRRYESLYGKGSEMRRDEHHRLTELVKPRGRTWEERMRERYDTPSQLPLF